MSHADAYHPLPAREAQDRLPNPLLLLLLLLVPLLALPFLAPHFSPSLSGRSLFQFLPDVVFSTHPPVESRMAAAPVRFLAVGDWGRNGTYNQSLVAAQMAVVAEQFSAQFVVSTGDNFYEEGLVNEEAEEFSASFTQVYDSPSLQVPWYSVLGNHDYYGNVLAQLSPSLSLRDMRWHCSRSMRLSLPLCIGPTSSQGTGDAAVESLEDSSSSSSRGSGRGVGGSCTDLLDIFMYDTTPLVRSYRHKTNRHLDWRGLIANNWTQQERFQLQELEGALQSSSAMWKIVVGHHPVRSFGHHGDQKEMLCRVDPLLKRYGVDIYMNGHDHDLQHIKRDDSPVHYITNGGGSKAWREAFPSGPTPGLQYFWPGQGFGLFQVSPEDLRVTFYGVSGSILHEFTLTRND